MGKLRVLYLIDTLGVGGAERSLLTLIPALDSVEPLVCYLANPITLLSEFVAQGIATVSVGMRAEYGFPYAIRQALRMIRKYRPDVIHTTLFRADVVGRIAGRLTGVPVVSSWVGDSYGNARLAHFSSTVRWKYQVTRWIDRVTARLVARFVANSQAVCDANCAALGIDPEKVTVIYRGRSTEVYLNGDHSQRVRTRQDWPGGETAHYALTVGRLIPEKGQDILIDALTQLRQHRTDSAVRAKPDPHLLIVGDGREAGRLRSLATQRGVSMWVHLLGLRHDVPELLQGADIFLFPSRSEGFPGAVVEAMLTGLPIVVSDIPVHREIIEPGKTGILIPVDDATAWAAAWRQLCDDPGQAAALGRAAQSDALARFSSETAAARYVALYRSIAKTG